MTHTKNGGFEVADVQQDDGSRRSMTRSEYEALPLSQRISLVLQRRVDFYRGGVKISPLEALKMS